MMSLTMQITEITFLSVICLSAFTGNALLFIFVGTTPNLQTKGNIFILNLAAADLLVTVTNMPLTIVTVASGDWILGEKLCVASGFFTLLTFVASCMALSMISINRYHAIVHWTTYRSKYTWWKCTGYVALVWAVTTGLCIPPLFGWAKFEYDPGQSYCFADWSKSKSYTMFMIAACLFGPLAIMTYCYVKILYFHKNSRKLIREASRGSSHSGTSVSTGLDLPAITGCARSRRRLTRTIVTLIVVFGLCWSPFAIIMILQVFFNISVPRYIDFGSLILGYMNSLFNVLIYNATSRNIRSAFKKFLCLTTSRSRRARVVSNQLQQQPSGSTV